MATSLENNDTLPEGFTLENEVPQDESSLPEGFVLEKSPSERAAAHIKKKEERDTNIFLAPKTKEQALSRLKANVSGLTLGFSKLIPGMKPQEGAATDILEMEGSLVPVGGVARGVTSVGTKLFSKPLLKLAEKSPMAARGLKALVNLTGVAATGAIVEGAEEMTKEGELKAPTPSEMIEKGVEWAAIDAALSLVGKGGRFVKSLLKKTKESGQSRYTVLNDTLDQLKAQGIDVSTDKKAAEKALAILENKPINQVDVEPKLTSESSLKVKALAQEIQTQRVSKGTMEQLNNSTTKLAEPYLPREFEVNNVVEEAENEALDDAIDSIAPRASTEQEMGKNVQNSMEATKAASKAISDPLYKIAGDAAETISTTSKATAKRGYEILKSLESVKVRPVGYAQTTREVQNAIEDAGYSVRRDLETGELLDIIGPEGGGNVKKLMTLKQRLNKMATFDNVEPHIQNLLGNLASQVKEDILAGLKKNPKALEAFKAAEKEFASTAEKFKRKSIRQARYSEKPESIAKLIRTPSGLEDLKRVVSKEQYAEIERELMEYMKHLPEDRARAFYREMRPYLSQDTRSVAEQIIESKIPSASPTGRALRRDKIQTKIYDDIANAAETGTRPDYTLKLWKTTEGQQLIKHALKGNPNEAELLIYLEDQSLADFASSVTSADGVIDFKKFNELLKDPATVENLRLVGGQEAVTFFKQLEAVSGQLDKNISGLHARIEKLTPGELKVLNERLTELGEEGVKGTAKGSESAVSKEVYHKKTPGESTVTGQTSERVKTATGRIEEIKQAEQSRSPKAREERRLVDEEREKQDVFNKIDDFVSKYGKDSKKLLWMMNIISIMPKTSAAVRLGYAGIKAMARSKNVQQAFRDAASAHSSPPIKLVNALVKLEEVSEGD